MTIEDEALATLGLAALIVEVRDKERERCAKIVESGICDGLSYEDKALQKAADDIRKGESRYGLR